MAKRETKTADVIDIGTTGTALEAAAGEDQIGVAEAGRSVLEFMKGLGKFFVTAGELERTAIATLAEAERLRLRPPSNGEEDAAVQRFIKRTTAEGKAVDEHWKITTAVHGFHKRMTGARNRAASPLEQANKIANQLHNNYEEQERRRVAAENERRRVEAERIAQAERDAELARLEAEAVKREEAAPDCSEREGIFIDLYFVSGDGINSAKRAGFKNPLDTSARLLTLPKIQNAIKAKREAAEIRRQAQAKAAAPVIPDDVEEAVPDVQAESSSRTTKTGEITDEAALIAAVISGKYGIPSSILRVDQAALNGEARNLGALINRWPGCRLKEDKRSR